MEQIRTLPNLEVVFQSSGLAASHATFTDDLAQSQNGPSGSGNLDDPDEIKQMLFQPLGRDVLRPHLLVRLLVVSDKQSLRLPLKSHTGAA